MEVNIQKYRLRTTHLSTNNTQLARDLNGQSVYVFFARSMRGIDPFSHGSHTTRP